jgi:hypothetical protein
VPPPLRHGIKWPMLDEHQHEIPILKISNPTAIAYKICIPKVGLIKEYSVIRMYQAILFCKGLLI